MRSRVLATSLMLFVGFSIWHVSLSSPVMARDSASQASTPSTKQEVALPEEDPLELRGEIDMMVAGSASMYPMMRRMYKRFVKEGYRGEMKIRRIGTTLGFKLFCQEGKADIVMASRVIRTEESEACTARGVKPVELNVGLDALTVVTNIHNEFVDDVIEDDLELMFSVNRWSEVNDEWPNRLIERIIPASGTGTFDFFVDLIFDGEAEAILNAANTTMEKGSQVYCA